MNTGENQNQASGSPEPTEKISGIFFGHGVSEGKKKLRFTVAILPVAKDAAKIGVAICSAKDPFTKKIGRQMSEGRANKKPTFVFSGPSVDTTTIEGMLTLKKDVKCMIANDMEGVKQHMRELYVQHKGE